MIRRNHYRKGKMGKYQQKNLTLVNNSTVSKGSSAPVLFFSRMIDLHADSVFSRHTSSAVTAIADWASRVPRKQLK